RFPEQSAQVTIRGEGDKGVGYRAGRAGAVVGALREQALQQGGQEIRDLGAESLDRGRWCYHVSSQLLSGARVVGPSERRLTGQQMIERAAEAVEVGPCVHGTGVLGLFGG